MPAAENGDVTNWWDPPPAPAPAPAPSPFTPYTGQNLTLTQAGALGGPTQQWQGGGEGGNFADIPQVWQGAQYNWNGQNLTDDLGAYVTNGDATHVLQGGTSGVIANNQNDYNAYQASLAQKLGLDPTGHYLLGHSDLSDGIQQSTIYSIDPKTGQLTQAAANQYKPQSDWTGFWRPALIGSAGVIGASLGLAGAYGALGGAGTLGSDAGMSLAEGAYPEAITGGTELGTGSSLGAANGSWDIPGGLDGYGGDSWDQFGQMGGGGGGAGSWFEPPAGSSLGSTLKDLYNGAKSLIPKSPGMGGSGAGGSAGTMGPFSGGMSPGDRYRQQLAAQSIRELGQKEPGFQSVWSGPPT